MDEKTVAAMNNFCMRVLRGDGTPQEVAALPAILALLMEHGKTASDN